MPSLPPCKLYWANTGGRRYAWLGSPWAPLPLSSKEHKARTFLRSASWRGPAESGHGQSPGAELRRAGSRGVPSVPGWVRVEVRGTGPPEEADGGGTPAPMYSRRDSVTSPWTPPHFHCARLLALPVGYLGEFSA